MIDEDYARRQNFRKLPKIVEGGPKIFERYQKDCEDIRNLRKILYDIGP